MLFNDHTLLISNRLIVKLSKNIDCTVSYIEIMVSPFSTL